MFGPAQAAVASAVADSVADGSSRPTGREHWVLVGVFIHWDAEETRRSTTTTTKP